MLQHALKTGLMFAVLGFVAQDAQAFGRRGCGGWGGYGYGYGGWGYAGYGGWYGGYGYGYPGWGYGGFATNSNNGYVSRVAQTNGTAPRNFQPATDSVRLTVDVPANAKVVINDLPTTSTGEHRRYETKGIKPGYVYRYQVWAEFVRDGKPASEEKTVSLTAGQTASLTFNAEPKPQVAGTASTAQR